PILQRPYRPQPVATRFAKGPGANSIGQLRAAMLRIEGVLTTWEFLLGDDGMSPLITCAMLFIGVAAFCVTMYWRLRAMAVLKPEPHNRLDRVSERVMALVKFGLG